MSLFSDDSDSDRRSKSVTDPPTAGLTLHEVRRLAKRKLTELVIPAISALERATTTGDKDDYISVKAACAILDRTGFGVHSTITIDDKADYSKMTREQLLARLDAAKAQLAVTPAEQTDGKHKAPSISDTIPFPLRPSNTVN